MVNYTPNLLKPQNDIDRQTNKTATDILVKSVLTLGPGITISKACELIEKNSVSGAPVVNEYGKLLGFLSQKDCLKFLLDIKYYNGEAGLVKDFMSKTLMTIHPAENLLYICELFLKNHFQVYPVVDEEGIFLGVVSRTRLFSELTKLNQTSW